MIDYLALLLERQAREEEKRPPDWSVLGRERAVGQAGTAEEKEAPPEAAPAGAEGAARAGAAAGMGGTADLEAQERLGEKLSFELPLSGAVTESNGGWMAAVRPAGGAERLYQQVRRSQARAGYSRPVSGVTPLAAVEPRPEARGVSPEGLDRVFQRDARRYDGGFTLF